MSLHPGISRRTFLRRTGVIAAASLVPACVRAQVSGANNAIRVGVAGLSRGRQLVSGILGLRSQGVRLVALCDVDQERLAYAAELVAKDGIQVARYTDIRKMIADREVDAVVYATPNHWHALGTIWACQAGKDVHVEKPVSHNVWEGRKMVEATRKYRRIVQTGTQCRSSRAIRESIAWVREGHLGRITVARGLCYKARPSIGLVAAPQPVPSGVDYDLWCGPAPRAELRRSRLHYDWHWNWETGNGDLGNQGVHQMDIARWFLGEGALSPSVCSIGGRLGYRDDGQTPNTQIVHHAYAKAPLVFEVRGLPKAAPHRSEKNWSPHMDEFFGADIGVVIHCEGGHVVVPTYTDAIAFDSSGREVAHWSDAAGKHENLGAAIRGRPAEVTQKLRNELDRVHLRNFFATMRSRKEGELAADILEGHLSSALCHTGSISYQLGQASAPGAIGAALGGLAGGTDAWERTREHLRANGIDIESGSRLTLGPRLAMDPQRETFVGHEQANRLLTRPYRAPFVVPEAV